MYKRQDRYDITNIEIGFGNGEFLIKNAITRPNELFIGVEVYLNGIAKVLESILDFGLKNIMLSNLNSFYFLEAMPYKSIDKIFLINPDPWVKKRHHKRRLMSYEILSRLNKVIKSGYELLGLINYFTCGQKETRSWTIKRETLAPQAAGKIHTDFEKGFIRAETVSYEDYIENNGDAGSRDSGKLRQEGKDYIVKDGDVMNFLFNV